MPSTAVMCCCSRVKGAGVAGTMVWVVGPVTASVVDCVGVWEGVVDVDGPGRDNVGAGGAR